MAASFDEILSSLCSRVSPVSETEFQQIFALGDSKEAKLAYDILLINGFEVKLYNDGENAKLYITRPALDAATLAAKLDAARVMAANFKTIKLSLDELHRNQTAGVADYTMTFVNNGNNTQIAISLIPAVQPSAAAAVKPVAKPPAQASAAARPAAKPQPKKPDGHELMAGPQISREYKFASKATRGQQEQKTVKNLLSRLFVQNIASNGTIILFCIFIGLTLISLIIASKSFLCPDFAVEKQKQNHSAFCEKIQQSDDNTNNKPGP